MIVLYSNGGRSDYRVVKVLESDDKVYADLTKRIGDL